MQIQPQCYYIEQTKEGERISKMHIGIRKCIESEMEIIDLH